MPVIHLLFGRPFVMVLIALGVMLVSFAVLGTQAVRVSTARTLQERRTLAEVIAGRVDDRLSEAIRIVQVMIETQHLDPAGDPVTTRHWIEDTHKHLGGFVTWMAVVDASGQSVVTDALSEEVRQFGFPSAKCTQYVFVNNKPAKSCAFTIMGQGARVQARTPISRDDAYASSAVKQITPQTARSYPHNYS